MSESQIQVCWFMDRSPVAIGATRREYQPISRKV